MDTLERICGALGVTLADFFSPDAALPSGMSSLSTEERELLGCYRMLTRTQQEDALLILRTLARKPRRVTARQFLLYYMLPADEKATTSHAGCAVVFCSPDALRGVSDVLLMGIRGTLRTGRPPGFGVSAAFA